MSNNKSELKVIMTNDGSSTLFNEKLNEHYHSTYGALNESQHVYINNGLNLIDKKSISILEIGFGTGLNAALTMQFANKNNLSINYTTIEPFPISIELVDELTVGLDAEIGLNMKLLANLEWGKVQVLPAKFIFKKQVESIQTISFDNSFDVIYFDAFAPNKQPEMWFVDIFKKLFLVLKPQGLLTTYCAQGQVKRNLKEVGFLLKSFPGPNGKREMTVAFKN